MPVPLSWRFCDRGCGRVHRSIHGGSRAAAAPAARLRPPLLPSAGDSGCGLEPSAAAKDTAVVCHTHERLHAPLGTTSEHI